ncbi:MAG TPA: RNA polymerase sigma-70 factor [Oryzihumus sp.]|nr:RNA polymerase sigma-70 factor [Oryzihumus sp.]
MTQPPSARSSPPRSGEELAREFGELRPLLVGAAYRVLGSVSDAEDVTQEAWLRWSGVDRSQVRDARAFLLTTTTRLALNRLRQLRSRREDYVGPWLPEPVVAGTVGDAAEAVELAESVSMAMLVVLETLSPLERATFVLHEVFGVPFGEIASSLGRSDAAVRQLAHRARSHVQARQPRHPVDATRHREVTERFLEAAAEGDMAGLLALLAPDAVLVSDGGGVKKAALRPIVGADKVARWLLGVLARPDYEGELRAELGWVNGDLAILSWVDDALDTVTFLTVEAQGITALHAVRNPAKLAALATGPA